MKPSTLCLAAFLLAQPLHCRDQAQNDTTSVKDPRLFSLFHIVTWQKSECTATSGDRGICQTQTECEAVSGGFGSGVCASGFGVCCVISLSSCGGTINTNCTYIISPGFPASTTQEMTCDWTVKKCSSDVCFIRLDFDAFTIAGPVIDAANLGNCATDIMTFDDATLNPMPPVCGVNDGQHFYYDIGPGGSNDMFMMRLSLSGTANSRRWKIKVSQIRCGRPETPPTACGNYLTGAAGTGRSFNFLGTDVRNDGEKVSCHVLI